MGINGDFLKIKLHPRFLAQLKCDELELMCELVHVLVSACMQE